jgi:osmoprotectant transport system ATP-binding protein
MIEYHHVTKHYEKKKAVDDLSLRVEEGEFVALIGPSGCGKTTTLKMTNRLIKIDQGHISINGQNILDVDAVQLRRNIGYVIQQIGLFPNMTIEENIAVVPKLLGWDKQKTEHRVHELLEMVQMPYGEYAKKYPNELSGGQQQRIGVLRALAGDPPIILMDEPFGALDPITREILQDEFKSLQKALRKTIVFVTHDMNEAIKMADKIVFMSEGHILQAATPEDMLNKPATPLIREFMGKHTNMLNNGLTCEDVMRRRVLTVAHTRKTLECVELMRQRELNTCVVIDDDEKYLGTVTIERIRKEGKPGESISRLVETSMPTVPLDGSAKEAFDLLSESGADYMVVLTPQERVAGIITRSSMSKALASVVWGDVS